VVEGLLQVEAVQAKKARRILVQLVQIRGVYPQGIVLCAFAWQVVWQVVWLNQVEDPFFDVFKNQERDAFLIARIYYVIKARTNSIKVLSVCTRGPLLAWAMAAGRGDTFPVCFFSLSPSFCSAYRRQRAKVL
jgi:hypothetical protein